MEGSPFEHQDEPARFLGGAMARELTEQVAAGRWRLDDRAGVFRPTFTSAWVMTWQALPPVSMLRRRGLHRRAVAILKESLAWVAALAITVLLLTRIGGRVLRTSGTLPSDFVAPAAFNQPFVLTGMGFDWVEGRFRSAIGDADALARRFYAFCPDVVDQGTQTVDALARELRDSQQLYCWWD